MPGEEDVTQGQTPGTGDPKERLKSMSLRVNEIMAHGRREGVEACLRVLDTWDPMGGESASEVLRREMADRGWL